MNTHVRLPPLINQPDKKLRSSAILHKESVFFLWNKQFFGANTDFFLRISKEMLRF